MRLKAAFLPSDPLSKQTQQKLGATAVMDKAPTFGNAMGAVNAVVDGLYGRGEGVRYAVEQTLGYTVPRTVQQLYRTKQITGEKNKQAAEEMLFRDLAADFEDTFLPGLLATFVIARVFEAVQPSYLKYNLDKQHLGFFRTVLATSEGEAHFFSQMEKALLGQKPKSHLGLADEVKALAHFENTLTFGERWKRFWTGSFKKLENPFDSAAERLADKLKLTSLDVTLSHEKQTLHTELTGLLTDLTRLKQHAPDWESKLGGMLKRTEQLQPWQGLGILIAFGLSLATPFLTRQYSKWRFGSDEYGGSRPIREFFDKKQGLSTAPPKDQPFRLFPYLGEQTRKGHLLPLAAVGTYFSFLAGAVGKHFVNLKEGFTLKRGLREFLQFDRVFPFTTLRQMTATYGVLCGIRLMASRDESEFRETAIRDTLLGFPTLTWGNIWLRNLFSRVAEPHLNRSLLKEGWVTKNQLSSVGSVLRKAGGKELRELSEFSQPMLKETLQLGKEQLAHLPKLAQKVTNTRNVVTLASAVTSWILLAFAEPQFGIWLTNHIELAKYAKRKQPKSPSHGPLGGLQAATTEQPTVTRPIPKAILKTAQSPRFSPSTPAMSPFTGLYNAYTFSPPKARPFTLSPPDKIKAST